MPRARRPTSSTTARGTTPLFSTGNGARASARPRRRARPRASRSAPRRSSAAPAGTRSTGPTRSSMTTSMVWSNRGPGANGSPASTSSPTARSPPATDAQHHPRRPVRLGDVGRHQPLDTGRGRRDGAGLPGVAPDTPAPSCRRASTRPRRTSSSRLPTTSGYEATIQGAGSVDAGDAVQTALGSRAPCQPRTSGGPATIEATNTRSSPPDAPGGTDSQDVHHQRWRHVGHLRPPAGPHRQRDVRLHEQEPVAGERLQLQRARLPDRPDRSGRRSPGCRPHGRPGELPARPVRRQTATTQENQAWRLLTYNWTDINHDGNLWTDTRRRRCRRPRQPVDDLEHRRHPRSQLRGVGDGQGRVRPVHVPPAGREHPDVFRPRPERPDGRRRLPRPAAPGPQHAASRSPTSRSRSTSTRTADWSWVTTPASASGSFTATIDVPEDTPYGMYEGAIVLTQRRRLDRRAGRPSPSRRPPTQDEAGPDHRLARVRWRWTSPRRRRTTCTTTARSSAPTTGPGGPSPATGASSSSTSPRSRPTARCSSPEHDVGRTPRRTPTSIP